MSTSLLLGIHCHQPVDNFSHVIDNACEMCYQPFLEVAAEFPEFHFSIHYSGWLLEYIQKNQKKTFKLLQEASERGSVEFFSGGYYEPILASIPSRDRIAQIKKLNGYIKRYFKQTPRGMWLTERVWDSSIIADAKACGIEYVIVDDYHFISIGYRESELKGYYFTEDDGERVAIFPIDKELRYNIPFKPASDVVNMLEKSSEEYPKGASVIFDDGEKFGIWPNTHEWVYEKGWLREFMRGVVSSPKIKAKRFSDYFSANRAIGVTYLPTASYYEMGEWSLSAYDAIGMEHLQDVAKSDNRFDGLEKFVKGGIWKNFFVKYEESNRIHKRVLELSRQAKSIKQKEYLDNLYKSECNDVLWHGVFGGLYLPNLRDNAYRFIINCENIRYQEHNRTLISIEDADMDGYLEAKAVSSDLISIFSAKSGGQMVEFDLRDRSFNLQNTLTRRKESYHYKMEMEQDSSGSGQKEGIDSIHDMDTSKLVELREHLKFDRYTKNSFIDHIVDYSLYLDNYDNCTFREYGDFFNSPYEVEETSKNSITLFRRGKIAGDGVKFDAAMKKEIIFKPKGIDFRISFDSECDYSLQYLLEMNFHFADLSQLLIDGKKIDENRFLEEKKKVVIKDKYLGKKIEFVFDEPINLFITKVDTISQSEAGFDHTNQALSFGFIYPYQKSFSFEGKINIGE